MVFDPEKSNHTMIKTYNPGNACFGELQASAISQWLGTSLAVPGGDSNGRMGRGGRAIMMIRALGLMAGAATA